MSLVLKWRNESRWFDKHHNHLFQEFPDMTKQQSILSFLKAWYDETISCQKFICLMDFINWMQDGCSYKHERDVVQIACCLHHCLHPETQRSDDQPGHREGSFLPLKSSVFIVSSCMEEFSFLCLCRSVRSVWWTWQGASGQTLQGQRAPDSRSEVTHVPQPCCWSHGYFGLLMFAVVSMQEGANINKSLTTLGKVISALAEMVLHSLKSIRSVF